MRAAESADGLSPLSLRERVRVTATPAIPSSLSLRDRVRVRPTPATCLAAIAPLTGCNCGGRAPPPDAIAVDDSYVYVIDGSGTWRIDKATGAATVIDASKVNPAAGDTAIASAGGNLVIASGLQWAYRLPKDGGTRAVLFDGGAGAA